MDKRDAEIEFMVVRALQRSFSRAALEVAVARGRLRRGHVTARSYLVDARGHLLRLKLELEQLLAVWSELLDLDEALDVVIVRRWEWALRLAAEDVELARSMLGRSQRQRVAHAMLTDAQRHVVRASKGLRELSRRTWGPLVTPPRSAASPPGRGANHTRRTPRPARTGRRT